MTHKADWTTVKFGDVVRQVKDKVDAKSSGLKWYVGGEHMDTDDLRIRRRGEITDDYLGPAFHMRFQPGQVLYGSRRTYLRKVAVADFEGICANTTFVLESKDPNTLLPELLPFVMQTEAFHEFSITNSKGSVNPYINFSDLTEYEFALPPLAEQRRIAEVLKNSRSTVESIQFALGSLRQLRISAIDTLCTRHDGKQVRLGDVCEMQNGRAFPGNQYQETGVRLLRPGNLGIKGYFDWDADKTVCLPESFELEARDYVIGAGDIVINLTAQSLEDGFMGRVCLAREGDHSLLNQRIGRFVFDSKEVCPEYVFRSLQSSRFQQHTVSMCEGTKVKHLYWRHLERFEFALPSIDEQRHVAKTLQEIDRSIDRLEDREKQQGKLHKSLLNSALGAAMGI
ncbi:MAG: restriction endonuclease subunit S [Anaerolineae bacterium]|nr:restriction endonuclease subunit S [Anaerolineae bacterium]